MAEMGHRVTAVDIDAERIGRLQGGHAPFFEPGLDDLISAGGSLAKNLGEGLIATFGAAAPTSRDASNALLCASDLVVAIDELNAIDLKGKGSSIAVAIGVHFGSVLLGDIGDENRLEVGATSETQNIARRLAETALLLKSNLVASDEVVRQAHRFRLVVAALIIVQGREEVHL